MDLNYLDLNYEPKNELVAYYYVEPSGISLQEACENIAAESSIGTWTDLSTMKPEIAQELKPHIFELDEEENLVGISYPAELFEKSNMPQVLSSIAGNIYGMKILDNLRLVDFYFPREFTRSFSGPDFGIDGVRNVLGVKDRPLVGTIVKPKVGLPSKEHAEVAFESWVGGCDIVKDDENLTNQPFNRFKDRIPETLEARDKAEEETGEKKIYMPNITSECNEMLERADYVKEHGGRYIMLDIVTLGFSAVQTVRQANLGMVIHAHRAMHAALTRNERHGLSMLALAKMARIVGVDQLHIGTVVGKMEGDKKQVTGIQKGITEQMHGLKPVFPVCSGGLHPGMVPELMHIMGQDIIIQAGGGIHGHPDGTRKGAVAMRQAVEATIDEIELKEHVKTHEELKKALEKWD